MLMMPRFSIPSQPRRAGPLLPLAAALAALLAPPIAAQSSGRSAASAAPDVPGAGSEAPRALRDDWSRGLGIDRDVLEAVQRGLAYLARHQNEDGSWTDRVGRKVLMSYRGAVKPHVGVTALAGLAFLAGGTLPDQGPGRFADARGRLVHGAQVVQKAIDYLIRSTSSTGYISANNSRMYSHAFATLFLAEAYGMGFSRDGGDLKRTLKRATQLIVNSQNSLGGWRYQPNAPDADMSVTVCQVMALRAARNAGIAVPKETIDAAVEYVNSSFISEIGAFTYQIEDRGLRSRATFPLTAAGLATLYLAGEYQEPEKLRKAVTYLRWSRPRRIEARSSFDYYYGQYYAVQAMFQRGGAEWRSWYEDYIKQDLLSLQEPDGCWVDLVGANYATAMATIILQFPNQYLPITEN
ncbi:MAG: prenyltransferase [Planctomycetes bacterium]|nr:prenyltransferase [Planctomycetota bacterium]